MADHTEVAPPQGPASYDFNALNDACVAGKSHEDALAASVVEETVAAPAPGTEPAPPADAGTDGLEKLTKAELRALLDDRPSPVPYETNADHARLLDLVRKNPAPAPAPLDAA
jgi:hypothetical protein